MAAPTLTIDLDAIAENWRRLNTLSAPGVTTAAVVKADSYGLGAAKVAQRLYREGVRNFFVALAGEGAEVRAAIQPDARIYVFGGNMAGDSPLIRDHHLIPLLNSPAQVARHFEGLRDHPFGVQLDTGMNRLGLEAEEFAPLRNDIMARTPALIMSHLACADEPEHPQNRAQLAAFHAMTDGLNVPRSLSATGGILLGGDYHFNLCRPGIGLYGGEPFLDATPTVRLSVPVVQTRNVRVGESVGYGAAWTATRPSRIATLAAGYADGLIRAMGAHAQVFAQATACPVIGRVSMDLLTVDVTDLDAVPDSLDLLGPQQGVDALAMAANTIGYEILTSLGARYERVYTSA